MVFDNNHEMMLKFVAVFNFFFQITLLTGY